MARKGVRREQKRVAKSERKNLRLWADGSRETVLAPHLDEYSAALDSGRVAERACWKKICREFHARIPWRTTDAEEPVVGEWDPASPIVAEKLSPEDTVLKRARVKELDARIRRWFLYRIRRVRKRRASAGLDPTKDPYAVLLAKLSGLKAPPKARQGYQQFMREEYADKIGPVVAERWAMERKNGAEVTELTKEPKAGFRAEVARSIFKALSKAEQDAFGARAKAESSEARAAYERALKDGPSQTPADRQQCIKQLGDFMGPILQGIYAYTGLHSTLMLGGPMPEYGGQLRTTHVSFGRNKTAKADHWPQWDKPRFATVQNFMVDYLKTAFSDEDCAAAALDASLAGAKYTIDQKGDADHSDTSSDSDSEDESDSDSDDDLEETARAKKKRKVGTQATASAATSSQSATASAAATSSTAATSSAKTQAATAGPSAPATTGAAATSSARPLTYEEVRLANIARWKPAQDELRRALDDIMKEVPGKNKKRERKKKATATEAAAPRRSGRKRNDMAGAGAPTPPSNVVTAPADGALPPTLPNTAGATPADGALPPTLPTPPSTAGATPADGALPPRAPSAGPVVPRARTASTVPACPAKAAPWFVAVHNEMTRVDLGHHFHALIAAWTRVEAASRFTQSPSNLSTVNRPPEVSTWVRGLRKVSPVVKDVPKYALQWEKWWDSLQPEWRKRGTDGKWMIGEYGKKGREWGRLYVWGVNGTLSLVASLYFWGCAVGEMHSEARAKWEEAVGDVTWILEGMAAYYELFKGKW